MKKKKHKQKGVRVCEICGNEIYKLKTVKCPYCGKVNIRIEDKKDIIYS